MKVLTASCRRKGLSPVFRKSVKLDDTISAFASPQQRLVAKKPAVGRGFVGVLVPLRSLIDSSVFVAHRCQSASLPVQRPLG